MTQKVWWLNCDTFDPKHLQLVRCRRWPQVFKTTWLPQRTLLITLPVAHWEWPHGTKWPTQRTLPILVLRELRKTTQEVEPQAALSCTMKSHYHELECSIIYALYSVCTFCHFELVWNVSHVVFLRLTVRGNKKGRRVR